MIYMILIKNGSRPGIFLSINISSENPLNNYHCFIKHGTHQSVLSLILNNYDGTLFINYNNTSISVNAKTLKINFDWY